MFVSTYLAKVKKTTKEKEKPKAEKKITDDELRTAICEILKEVDFNTVSVFHQ